jgi:hypothetical protein
MAEAVKAELVCLPKGKKKRVLTIKNNNEVNHDFN